MFYKIVILSNHRVNCNQLALHHLYKNSLLYGGLGIIVAGGLVTILGFISNPISMAMVFGGLGITGGGVVLQILGIGPRNILTVGQAQRIADEYNQALLEEIFGEGE